MKKILVTLAIVAFVPLLAAPAAEAGIFSVGVAFNVGGFFFDLGFGGPRYSAHASHHVYRVSEPIHYSGYQCHSGCYRDAGYYYHHADCPLVAYHFRSYGFSPYVSYPSFFAPPAYGYYGYRSYGSHHRHYRPYRDHRYYRHHRPYVHRDHRPGWSHRGDRHRYDRHRGDRHHDRGVRGHRNDHRRRDLSDRRHRGERERHQRMDRSERRREEARGDDRRRGARRRDAGSSRSRDGRGRRP